MEDINGMIKDSKNEMCKTLPYMEYEEWEELYNKWNEKRALYYKEACACNGRLQNFELAAELTDGFFSCWKKNFYDPRKNFEEFLRNKFNKFYLRTIYRILYETEEENLPLWLGKKLSFPVDELSAGPDLCNITFKWRLNSIKNIKKDEEKDGSR